MPYRILGLSCVALLAFSTSPAWSASNKHLSTPVEKNIQRLLKTNACPACDLTGADLSQSRLAKANLSGANLSGANLNLADLSGANLQQANLNKADLSKADLSFADLEGAEIRGTNLDGARFERTRIKGRTVNRLIHADTAQANFVESAPTDQQITAQSTTDPLAHLPPPAAGPAVTAMEAAPGDAIQAAVEAEHPQFTAPTVNKPTAATKAAEEVQPQLDAARLQMLERMFDEERCIGCDLSGLDLSNRDMDGFDLERANFSGSNLQGADFSKANLKGALLQNSQLQKADLSEADLYRADFTGADLTDADLEDAKREGADFNGTTGLKPAEPGAAQ